MTETIDKPVASKRQPTLQEVRDNLGDGWTVSDIGTTNSSEYLITHDGRKDDGTFGAGHAFKVSNLSDVALAVKHFGRIPEA